MSILKNLFGSKPTDKTVFEHIAAKAEDKAKPETKPITDFATSYNTAPWRTFSIFISSTFADMQAERDFLKHVVIPRVEEELQKKRIRLEIVDLRWGVDTTSMEQEDEREANVLKVCLDEIKRCRPFFIGLLGDRYGWVPPAERIEKAIIGEDIDLKAKGKSVTDLEIEFGVLASKDQLIRSVFFFREPLPYDKFSEKKAAMYSDAHNPALTEAEKVERVAALGKLKTSIQQHFDHKKLKDKVKTYIAIWDSANEIVTGLKDWGEIVYKDIIAECESHSAETWNKTPQDWHEQELALLDAFVESHTHETTFITPAGKDIIPTFCGRKPLINELKHHLLSGDSANWGLALTGESGSGKSAVFSMIFKEMQQQDCFVLAHSAGLSPNSKSVASLLQKWNKQLAGFLGITEPLLDETKSLDDLSSRLTDDQGKPVATPIEKLQEKFLELLQFASAKKRVVLLIDALDRFEPTARAQHMSWLPTLMPKNVKLLITAITGTEQKAMNYHNGLSERSIDIFSAAEANEMLLALCKRQHKTLPVKIEKIILDKRRKEGQLATSSPLWLSLAVNMLMALDNDDFEKISMLEGVGGQQIESYMATMALNFDPLPGPLFLNLVKKAGTVFGEQFTNWIFDFIAISRNGLREKDLEKLILSANIAWDSLQFANLRRWFKAHLILQGEEQQWNLAHSILRSAIIHQKNENKLKEIHSIIAGYLLPLIEDTLKATETIYHLINAGNNKEAALYYSNDLTEKEAEGATNVLEEIITADEKGLALVSSFPSLVINEFESFHGLLKRFVYNLSEALMVEGNLNARQTLLEVIKNELEKNYERKILDECFGYDFCALNEKLGSIHQSMGHMKEALKYFEQLSDLIKELKEANPLSESYKNGLAISYSILGSTHQSMGHMEEALKYFDEGVQLFKELNEANPRDESHKFGLAVSYEKFGSIHQSMGQMEEALKYFGEGLKLFKELYQANPRNESLKEGVAVQYERLGDIHHSMGHMEEAHKYYEMEVQLIKEIYEANPLNEKHKNDLAISYERLASTLQAMGHMEEALKYFEKDSELTNELYEANPRNESLKNGLAISFSKLGSIHQSMGNLEEALKYFVQYSDLSKELYEANPMSESLKNSLAVSFSALGDIFQSMGHHKEAFKYYEEGIQLFKELYEANPLRESHKNGLAVSYEKLGTIHQSMGHEEKALEYFGEGEKLFKELYEANPQREFHKNGLAILYSKLGTIHESMGHIEDALIYFQNENQLNKELYEANPINISLLENFGISNYKIAMIYKTIGNNAKGKEHFSQWKYIITYLETNIPEVYKYKEWNNIEYD